MGRRGRPTKVKAVPRKRDDGGSDPEDSSSSPDRYLFHSSKPTKSVLIAGSSAKSTAENPSTVGLSWISVWKGQSPTKCPAPSVEHIPNTSHSVPKVQPSNAPSPPGARRIAKVSRIDVEPEVGDLLAGLINYSKLIELSCDVLYGHFYLAAD
ncbi:unnamed protein product [Amaranthus hypochondriacus]